jgi:hypothetical protein
MPSISRAQLLRDHPGSLSKKKGHVSQLVDLPCYSIWNHASMMVSLSLPSHVTLDAKTSCTRTYEKPVWNHALRVSCDCCDTDAGISKFVERLVQLKDTVTETRSLSKFAPSSREDFSRTTPSIGNANEWA